MKGYNLVTNFRAPLYQLLGNCRQLVNIDGLQPIPRESKEKDVAAMLDELTIEPNEESFVIVLQHGGSDVTWKRYGIR